MWQCPLCASPLSVQTNQPWRCDKGHSFDVAKQGYVNLLPVQFKNSLQPGDDKAMVQAREAFLNAGFYDPLIQAISKIFILFFSRLLLVKIRSLRQIDSNEE